MTTPYYTSADGDVTLYLADALDVLPTLPDASVDAVVCDPPYGLADHHPRVIAEALAAWLGGDRAYVPDGPGGFMNRAWDRFVPPPAVWDECLRVLRPGGHLLAFAAPRTADLMGLSIRLAGFEIRDSLHWITSQGMPKGQNIGKALDKAAGAEREVVGHYAPPDGKAWNLSGDVAVAGYESRFGKRSASLAVTAPATDEARQWHGWNTQLRPAHEPIILARKSTAPETTVANVLRHGTGALNVDGCRTNNPGPHGTRGREKFEDFAVGDRDVYAGDMATDRKSPENPAGRWPTNVLLTHSPLLDADGQIIGDACAEGCQPQCPVAEMDRQSGVRKAGGDVSGNEPGARFTDAYGECKARVPYAKRRDEGGASRFFPIFRYEAKAPGSERPRLPDGTSWPTVKPLALMQWLVRLITPPGGVVLDWCAGTGTTLQAATAEGMRAIGIERERDGADLCVIRLGKPIALGLFGAS